MNFKTLVLAFKFTGRRHHQLFKMAVPGKLRLITGLPMAIPVGKWVDFSVLFSVSVKVLPVTPLLSGVFVHRAFCVYFLRIERVVGNA